MKIVKGYDGRQHVCNQLERPKSCEGQRPAQYTLGGPDSAVIYRTEVQCAERSRQLQAFSEEVCYSSKIPSSFVVSKLSDFSSLLALTVGVALHANGLRRSARITVRTTFFI